MERRLRRVRVFAGVFAVLGALPAAALAQEAPDPFLLPSARNVWAILESQSTGVVTDRVDVGGLRSGSPAHFGGLGNTWTQNRFTFGALDVTDPESGGVPLVDPELDFIAGVAVETAEHDAEAGAPGILVDLEPRAANRSFRAGADVFYTDRGLQSPALAEQERESGISSPELFDRYIQASAFAGGPLSPDGPGILADVATNRLSRFPENVPVSSRSDRISGLISLSHSLGAHEVRLFALASRQTDPSLGASAIQPASSSLDAARTAGALGASDSWTLDSSRSLDVHAGWAGASFDDRFERSTAGTAAQSSIELFQGTISGAAPLASAGHRGRFDSSATWRQTASTNLDVEAGGGWAESSIEQRDRAFQDVNLQLLNGQPESVALFDASQESRRRIRDLSLFAQATFRPNPHLLATAGLRLERTDGWLPGASAGSVRWTTLSPRAAIVATAGESWTFRASWARYGNALLGSDLAVFDPRTPSGQVALWNDANGDGQYQAGEEGQILRTFGGRYSSVDPGLRRPTTDELAIGAEWHSRRPWVVGLTYRERRETHLLETVNTGVPDSSYSPVPWVDPGEDGVIGTGDDRTITVDEQDAATLGHDHFLLTNPSGFRAIYQGLELETTASDSRDRFRILASFAAYRIVGSASQAGESLEYDEGVIGNLYDDPNSRIHADGRLFFDRAYSAKLAATYRFAGDWSAGCVAKYADGLPFARKILVTGLNQGPFYVFATQRGNRSLGSDPRNGNRTEYTLTLDLGLEKGVRLGGSRLAARLDVFNVTNTHKKTRENDLTGPDFQQRIARETQAPRVFRFGLSLEI